MTRDFRTRVGAESRLEVDRPVRVGPGKPVKPSEPPPL
ncbi:predicted protein [Aspergillus nidulans FGSC A4]|uniref:Uncharacterized protein n=1 Tax=Emericella nidulans (strain FGSC A4 / ATCC 38163 / CBS 112.46 / NRRL 194 / M139) TaxID=227321 RepID=Q5BDA7_EMENI|nr:hypothetical protein [Aspergillus nidulans FGSC A4]EAA64603.1 predicted protein [Aspergillus nidulans FGSC A4]CBF84930.1 TPA: hypothetical protein ANIA_01473 [Aspergillus nidulans FGSC A4]|eukprot:XP_659077.1 predicted protein [Aspergillus nidulans FGSC A4]